MYNDFTIVGDPHATLKSLDKINQLTVAIENLGLPTIWLGDLLDTKEVIRGKCQNTWFNYFTASKLHHTIIIGNHDWFNHDCEEHSLEGLKLLPNVTVIDEFTLRDNIYFLPYIHDQEELKKLLKKIPKDAVVFGHFEIKSFDFGNGHICDKGMTTKSLTRFKRVISGHFHKYQQKDNFTYLGSPFSHSFGEVNQDKFLGRYALNEDKLELLPTTFPRHVSYEIDCDKTPVVTLMNNPNDHVRIILTGSQDNIDKTKSLSTINENIKLIERSTDDFDNQAIVDETADNLSQFNVWATDIQQLDAETIKLGLQILGAVNGR